MTIWNWPLRLLHRLEKWLGSGYQRRMTLMMVFKDVHQQAVIGETTFPFPVLSPEGQEATTLGAVAIPFRTTGVELHVGFSLPDRMLRLRICRDTVCLLSYAYKIIGDVPDYIQIAIMLDQERRVAPLIVSGNVSLALVSISGAQDLIYELEI